MKPGFSLLEVLVAIALGSLIGVAIFTSFFQVNRGYKMASRMIDFDSKVCIVQHQLERDFSGAFVPLVLEEKKEAKTAAKKEEPVSAKTASDGKKIGSEKEKKEEKEKVETPLKDAFLSRVQDNNTTLFSFITSNPLRVYGKEIPRIARVVYKLVPEKQKTGVQTSYELFRAEYKNLPFEEPKEKISQGLKLVDGIKNISIEYEVRVDFQKDEGKEQKFKYETSKIWSEEQVKKFKRSLPNFVTTTISFWDRLKKKSRQFVFKTAIVADEMKPKKKKTEPKKSDTKNKNGNKTKGGGKTTVEVTREPVSKESLARSLSQVAEKLSDVKHKISAKMGGG